MFDNNVHYIRKELESIYTIIVENLGKELLNTEIKRLEYEPKMDRININNFIFIRLTFENEYDHKELYYDIYIEDEDGHDVERALISVEKPFTKVVDKISCIASKMLPSIVPSAPTPRIREVPKVTIP